MTDITTISDLELAHVIAESVSGKGEGEIGSINELFRRYRVLQSKYDTLVEKACAYIDRTANNSARDSTSERDALIACLPELGPMVWDDEKGHYVRLPAGTEVPRG